MVKIQSDEEDEKEITVNDDKYIETNAYLYLHESD